MSRKLRTALAAMAVLAAVVPAHAQMRQRAMSEPRADTGRAYPQQQAEPPREMQQRQESMPPGRLSPEERRQLRRDVHEAGRELYRANPPHPSR